MASLITTLKDATKTNELLPRTRIKAVYDDNGNALSSSLTASDINALADGGLAAKADKVSTPTAGDILKTDASGNPVDTGIPAANVAQQDGYYEGLTAGNAEQLIASVFEQDKTPYNFRTSGGSLNIGDREYKRAIVGGSFGVNQIISSLNYTSEVYGITRENAGIGKIRYYGTSTNTAGYTFFSFTPQLNHIYYVALNCELPTGTKLKLDSVPDKGTTYIGTIELPSVGIEINSGVTVDFIATPVIIDLTIWFGSTIADYIATLESSTAGAGVAWFRKYFPKSYYAYKAGSLESVCVGAHNTIGFNQWDEEWEVGRIDSSGEPYSSSNQIRSKNFIPVVSNTNYYYYTPFTNGIVIKYYDFNKKYIGEDTGVINTYKTTPQDCGYIKFYTYQPYGEVYNHDICINLHWDGERDGEYEPYVKHNYPLDHTKELRGIPKLDASNNLYYDGDVYKSDGVITRKVGKKTYNVPSEVTAFSDSYTNVVFYLIPKPSDSTFYNDDILGNGLASKFELLRTVPTLDSTDSVGKILCGYSLTHFFVGFVAGTTLAQAQEALSTLSLIYELATPTTEEATPYTELQIVDDFGTEEFVDYPESQGTRDVAIPVGHVTDYQPNLRAKLEMAPNNPDDNGKYLLQMDSGEASYVPYVDPDSRLDDLEEIVASTDVPTTQGTYVLTCTVDSEGSPTFSWEAQS